MDVIVLVKQVPDVSNIPEEAWDREKGTLRRAMLDSVTNPLDLHALTFAEGLVRRWDGEKVVLSPSNCLHCMTCAVKCPFDNITWQPPEGGEGPRFAQM